MKSKIFSEPLFIFRSFAQCSVLMSADFVGEGDYDYSGANWEG